MPRKKKVEEAQIEDITPIEEVIDSRDSIITEVPGEKEEVSEEPELTEEQKKQQESFMRGMVISRYRATLRDIYIYMKEKGKTLDDIRKEILEKKCYLTTSHRDFIMSFKLDFIQQLLDDMYHLKEDHNEE